MTNPLDNTRVPSAFEQFLGAGAAPDNPLQLLGLSAKGLTEAGVITALQRQLTRIGASPDALTPEADEVRLALHAAAARLLDPTTRRQVLAGAPGPQAAAPNPSPDANPGEMPVQAAMLMAMGASGGMNRRSMEKMAMLAKAHGLRPRTGCRHGARADEPSLAAPGRAPAARKLRAAARMGMPPRPAALGAASPTIPAPADIDPSAPMPEEVDPARGTVKAILIFGGAGLLSIVMIAILVDGVAQRQ